MAQGKGVRQLIKKAHAYAEHHGVIGPVRYKKGPWIVEGTKTRPSMPWARACVTPGGSASTYTFSLIHYGTEMLRWRYTLGGAVEITGTWTGWGSVSDQTGVNAALDALGSRMRYSRDRRGGGPRVNPFVASRAASIRPATPPVY